MNDFLGNIVLCAMAHFFCCGFFEINGLQNPKKIDRIKK